MTSHARNAAGGQAWFGLVIAIATFAASLLLWSDAWADEGPQTPDGMVRLSEINEGALLLKTMDHGVYVPAPMIATDIELDISGPVVRAIVTQRFENPSEAWVEGTYVFPMPEDSGVDRLRMQIGDRFIEGEIHERQQARQIYERAREAGQRASLVEQERPNMFTTSVANIGPGETIIVQIEYQDIARLDDGQFEVRVPLAITPRYIPQDVGYLLASTGSMQNSTVPDADRITPPLMLPEGEPEEGLRLPVTIRAHLDAGFELGQIAGRFHATLVRHTAPGEASIELANGPIPADRDFVLTWQPADRTRPSAALFTEEWNGQTYMLAQILPPAELSADIPRRPRETIFVIDNSGSMAGTSMQQAREALIFALERLHPTDNFNVIRFDNTMEQVFPQAVPANWENVGTALEFARGLDAEGGTEMLPALVAALRDGNADDTSRVRQIVFLTDGAIGNEAQLFEAIHRGMGRSRLFPVGIGSAPNTYFMSRAARLGRGTFTHIGQVSDVAEEMENLFTALERPVMTNLDAIFPQDAISEIWPAPLPDLYYGEPVVMTARLNNPQGVMILEGQTAGETWREQLSLSDATQSSGIATLFGRNRIRGIEETRFQGANMEQVDAGVLQTALDFHLVSRLTSLVAIDATPARPSDETLVARQTPNMIPDGWDFEAVMDDQALPVQHASLDTALIDQLRPGLDPSQTRLDENGLPLPATATPRELLTWLGALMMLLGLIWLLTHQERRLW
ncbi:marine proteobacterial sortase target protein [Maricaulis sp.]|uniref:marine proteobacterial sortase target protein n=1 Tax=unclassified Maricaulis TaxID=2632371 RepID=UPI001B217123|nr:marine proteobacterial sortase target protein [Maricaulis sp.]MBO6797613.1 marine proteobacterial sortase target protein [Maricaulis sp.]